MALIQQKNSIVTPYSIHNMVLFNSECKLSQLASFRAGKFSFHMVFQSRNHVIKGKIVIFSGIILFNILRFNAHISVHS